MNDVDTMSFLFLSTKLHIPHPRSNRVARPRLVEKLLASVRQSCSFVLVSGPAGFGKTTLLSDFVVTLQNPVAWVSLDGEDNDPVQFWTYTIAALQSTGVQVGNSALKLLQGSQPLPDEAIPTLLINDLTNNTEEPVLILDDYHVIQNALIHEGMAFLLDHLPANLHPIISTRVDPAWPLARFRARGQLVEIRSADLRFTVEETDAFLNQVMHLSLSTENIAVLESRTEGWIASLQLAAISMQERKDIKGFIQSFTGSHVFVAEYLMDEVLGNLSNDITRFLLQTSILERMNADVCRAISEQKESQAILKNLYQANLFVIPLDDEGQWFRYHRLFADLLRARLQQNLSAGEINSLHRRAATWYEEAGMVNDAMQHLLAAADYEQAVILLEKIAPQMILKAYFKTVEDWLHVIPSQYIWESARLNMTFAWMFLMRRDPVQAGPYLERLHVLFSSPEASRKYAALQGEWLALQSCH